MEHGQSGPKYIFAYVETLQQSEKVPFTIKTDLVAIRFFHDLIPKPRYTLLGNDALNLILRTFGNTDRTWSASEFNRVLSRALAASRRTTSPFYI